MKLDRRKFLGVAAASPLAAKEIATKAIEEAQMQATGISLHGDSLYTGIVAPDLTPNMKSLWQALSELGIPDWKMEDLREDARRSRTLDPDIATMQSLSLNAKMRMQWDRNYELLVDRAMRQTHLAEMKQRFFKDNPDVEEY